MEGYLQFDDSSSKKGLFSLKSKKKYLCSLQGTTLTYTKDGETNPTGQIVFTTSTIVEGSPKGKRLISIKNDAGEWDLICPDTVAYGKWMDCIALVFRTLHVDDNRINSMLTSGYEGEDISSSTTPRHDSQLADSIDSTTQSGSQPNSTSNSLSSLPSLPSSPPRSGNLNSSDSIENSRTVSKPSIPSKPNLSDVKEPNKPETTKTESKPEVAPKPVVPPRLPSSVKLSSSSPPNNNNNNNNNTSSSGAKRPLRPLGPAPTVSGLKELSQTSQSATLPRTTTTTTTDTEKSPRAQLTPKAAQNNLQVNLPKLTVGSNSTSPNASPRSGSVSSAMPPKSSRLSESSDSSQAGPVKLDSSRKSGDDPNKEPLSARNYGTLRGRLETAPSAPISKSSPINQFIVWMPNGMKHASIYVAEQTVKSYLTKICKTREEVQPNTFLVKDADGNTIDMETKLMDLKNNEVYWDTLAPGQTMPAEFNVVIPKSKGPQSPSNSNGRSDNSPSTARGSSGSSSTSNSSDFVLSAPTPRPVSERPSGPPVDRRTNIVNEILTTEQSYVSCLLQLQDQCTKLHAFLKESNQTQHDKTATNLPSIELVNKLFPKYFDMIVQFNVQLKDALETAIVTNNDMDSIGALFMKYGSFLKMYNEYSSDYHNSLNTYNKVIRDYPAFAAKLEELRAASGSKLRFEDYIIMPVQRVPRYSLLLADLLKYTDSSHVDYVLIQQAIQQMNDIGSFINESVRKSDNAKRIQELEAKGAKFDKLITPTRFLVREGPVKVTEQKKKETKHFFLFNDVLVSVKDSLLKTGIDLSSPEYVWPLNLVWIIENETFTDIIGPHGVTMSIKKKKSDLTWIKDLNYRITQHIMKISDGTASVGSKRVGAYLSSSDENYDGEWQNGYKHGHGTSIVTGTIYEGSWEYGKRSGKGTLTYANGMRYIGDWKLDVQQGEGILYSSTDEETYNGHWVSGTPHGSGTMTYLPSGDKYVGEFVEGRCTGRGTLTCKNGMKYEGGWKEDQFEGQGTLVLPDQYTYEGLFKNGLKHGKGFIKYADGVSYVGDFFEGMRQGKGEFTDGNGSFYDGDWLNDRPEGKGLKIYPDKSKYEGQFTRGVRRGVGKIVYADNSKYEGNWLEDLPHGMGTHTFADGSQYTGEWLYGRREGKGTITYASQAKYDGSWFNDRFHKSGIYVFEPGHTVKSYDGEWQQGKMTNKGSLQFSNGDTYKGNFKDGRMHGAGTYTYASGANFVGKWNLGKREGKGTYSLSTDDKNGQSGSFEVSGNVFVTSDGASLFLPPQQPLLLPNAGLEARMATFNS